MQGKQGIASSCIRIGEGCWFLKSSGLGVLVCRGPECKELPQWIGNRDRPGISFRPGLILLSGEPALEVLEGLPDMEEMPLVIDGSNRSWYKQKLSARRRHIYLTDLEGAYVKRW